jgi:hypothetical protein
MSGVVLFVRQGRVPDEQGKLGDGKRIFDLRFTMYDWINDLRCTIYCTIGQDIPLIPVNLVIYGLINVDLILPSAVCRLLYFLLLSDINCIL